MADTDTGLWVDGEHVTLDDLTFGEQHRMRKYAKELAGTDDIEDAGEIDLIPAMVCVVKQRTDKDFTLEQALEVKPKDLEPPKDVSDPPTPKRGTTGRRTRS